MNKQSRGYKRIAANQWAFKAPVDSLSYTKKGETFIGFTLFLIFYLIFYLIYSILLSSRGLASGASSG